MRNINPHACEPRCALTYQHHSIEHRRIVENALAETCPTTGERHVYSCGACRTCTRRV